MTPQHGTPPYNMLDRMPRRDTPPYNVPQNMKPQYYTPPRNTVQQSLSTPHAPQRFLPPPPATVRQRNFCRIICYYNRRYVPHGNATYVDRAATLHEAYNVMILSKREAKCRQDQRNAAKRNTDDATIIYKPRY
ncbi:18141_t:CDS:2 [Acaulospora morrowiae]|uniref:18141_t:CDS:1 n=1 Tax=Acaulospora morrowiae TaxID=94023 RepID=A0A9N9GX59_9GLOM|nr:18141_t:CDS:2 [Acaulospora morrowiae]